MLGAAKLKGMPAAQARLEAQKTLNGIRNASSDLSQEFEAPGIDDVAITAAHSFTASVKQGGATKFVENIVVQLEHEDAAAAFVRSANQFVRKYKDLNLDFHRVVHDLIKKGRERLAAMREKAQDLKKRNPGHDAWTTVVGGCPCLFYRQGPKDSRVRATELAWHADKTNEAGGVFKPVFRDFRA